MPISLTFEDSYPEPSGYLGKGRNTCGSVGNRDCRTGCIFFSSTIPSEEDIIESVSAKIRYTVNGVTKSFVCGNPEFREVSLSLIREYERENTTDLTYKEWLVTLKPHTEPKPSGKSFLGILQGFGDYYECKCEPAYGFLNRRSPNFKKGFWFERWPTEREVRSMKRNFDKFAFGVPSKPHCHGN